MRDHILSEIRRLAAANGGKAPGRATFERETGIPYSKWSGVLWARWGDAVAEAGFVPNALQAKTDSNLILEKLAGAVRHYGRMPTSAELRMHRQIDGAFPFHSTLWTHYPKKAAMIAALRQWTADRPDFDDVAAMLPAPAAVADTARSTAKVADGFVYLIRSGEFYKVGRSDDAERRFKQISVALPAKAELFHTIRTDDPPGIEAYWHRRFADRRANGEWFKLSAADVAAFVKRKFQ